MKIINKKVYCLYYLVGQRRRCELQMNEMLAMKPLRGFFQNKSTIYLYVRPYLLIFG
jgi:hypothetical protein